MLATRFRGRASSARGGGKVRTAPRKVPRQERSRATVAAILEAAARILVREGYEALTTNRVAAAAGVSIGSLYQYFPGKEAVVAALIRRHIDEELDMISRAIAALREAPLSRAVDEVVRAILRANRVNPSLRRVFLEQIPRVGEFQRLRDTRRQVEALVLDYLSRHRAEVRPRDHALAAFMLVNAVDAVLQLAQAERPELLEGDRIVKEVVDLVRRYLRRPKGTMV